MLHKSIAHLPNGSRLACGLNSCKLEHPDATDTLLTRKTRTAKSSNQPIPPKKCSYHARTKINIANHPKTNLPKIPQYLKWPNDPKLSHSHRQQARSWNDDVQISCSRQN
jgi:hypothetical protein